MQRHQPLLLNRSCPRRTFAQFQMLLCLSMRTNPAAWEGGHEHVITLVKHGLTRRCRSFCTP
jgi:hypothetical protein